MAVPDLYLDDFKINGDTRGPDCGDQPLVEVTRRIKGVLINADTIAQHGSDKFVVAGLDCLARLCLIQGYHFKTTASVGIALC